MAITTTIGTTFPGSDPAAIANRIPAQIANPDTGLILVTGVGLSAADAIRQLNTEISSFTRYSTELTTNLTSLQEELAALDPAATGYERRKARITTDIAAANKKIADKNSDIAAANDALAYINSGEYQAAIDQRVAEATQPAPKDIATPESKAGETGNSENPAPATVTTSPVPNPDVTATQTSVNEEAAYADAQKQAAAAEESTKAAIAAESKQVTSSAPAARLEANGLTAGANALKANPGLPASSQNGVKKEDLRVRIALAPQSPNIFYLDNKNELLKPLRDTQGVVFPVQPTISIGHEARYQATDLTHSNFSFYNYQNSAVKPISLTGDFLIRNPYEGRYCIAAIRFLQAMTKMFNANDTANNMRGAPPAVARLYGLGLMGFDSIPVAISSVDVTYGTEADLLSLAVAVNGSTEVTKLPASFQITVTMNPIFSREFATNFFGTQDYASGKVRLLGKSVITPIVTTNPAPAAPASNAASAAAGNVTPKTDTASNQTEPDSKVGNSGGSAVTPKGVVPASAPGAGTDDQYETTKERIKTLNADGSTTETVTETVNGVKKVTVTNTDKDGKVTTDVTGGASGTGANNATTQANATGNGGDSTQPKDEAATASAAEVKAKATADFVTQRDQIIADVQAGFNAIKQAISDYSATYLAMLNRNQASHQKDLAADQAELAAVQNGTMTFPTPGGFTSIAELQKSIDSEQKDIARRQANIDAGAPYYGLTQDQFNQAASTEPAYLSAKSSAQNALNSLGNLTSTRQSAVDFNALPNFSASWYAVPPEITINGKTLT